MYLKRYIRGLAIVLPVLGGIAIMVVATVGAAWESLNNIRAEGSAIDLAAINRIARGTDYAGTISFIIMGLWIFSVIDAYFIGKRRVPR